MPRAMPKRVERQYDGFRAVAEKRRTKRLRHPKPERQGQEASRQVFPASGFQSRKSLQHRCRECSRQTWPELENAERYWRAARGRVRRRRSKQPLARVFSARKAARRERRELRLHRKAIDREKFVELTRSVFR